MNYKLLSKPVIYGIIAGATGISAYCLYRAYNDLMKPSPMDEGFVDSLTPDLVPSKHKVLVLGLDDSGKSHLLSSLSKSQHYVCSDEPEAEFKGQPRVNDLDDQPDIHDHGDHQENHVEVNDNDHNVVFTNGCSVVCTMSSLPAVGSIHFWEVGGGQTSRSFWCNFIEDTQLLMYVVDSSNTHRFSESNQALHNILGDSRLAHVPILIVANKQDKLNSEPPNKVMHALSMDNLSRSDQHAGGDVYCVGTSRFDVNNLQKLIDSILR